jgi:excinuclease ABC subunit A
MSGSGEIRIVGARQHNLKNLTLSLPRNKITVITGPSGSGKSSLAFDTLFAEGQRRYVQSLSAYARQFLDLMDKPEVDAIEGLSPSIAIEQRSSAANPRSTIATVTELYDFLRVLYAGFGQARHPETGRPLQRMTVQQIVDRLMEAPPLPHLHLLAPVAAHGEANPGGVLEKIRREGFARVRLEGKVVLLDELKGRSPAPGEALEYVVDRLKADSLNSTRLAESVEQCLRLGNGVMIAHWSGPEGKEAEWRMSDQNYDPETGYTFPKLTPQHFSFNSPHGACPVCHGLGTLQKPDPALIVPDPSLSLDEGALHPWHKAGKALAGHYRALLRDLAAYAQASTGQPWERLPESFRHLLLHGSGSKPVPRTVVRGGEIKQTRQPFEGILAQIEHQFENSSSDLARRKLGRYFSRQPCPSCRGRRLRQESLHVFLSSGTGNTARPLAIHEFCALAIEDAALWLEGLQLSAQGETAAADLLKEIRSRLDFLQQTGLGYLALDREASTLSGGEMQRIRLATQIGSALTGVLYVLDEPSIGLHPSDQQRLLKTLASLRDLENTVVVVEHDEETMRQADYLVDLGPGAGSRGGRLVAAGTPEEIMGHPDSLTGKFLSGRARLAPPGHRRPPDAGWLVLRGARGHNLKNVEAAFPLGCLTCVTGPSGSGKSTLVNDTLSRALFAHLHGGKEKPEPYESLTGLEQVDKAIIIDQDPIGRTPRSNPVTYAGAFDGIRALFAQLPASRIRGYQAGRFSFNAPGGRCEHCKGDGFLKIEMHFLPDAFVPCEACQGRRYNRETLEITYKGRSIADILDLTIDAGRDLFRHVPGVEEKLASLCEVGLGYVKLGQPATTLSGGEAQRIKLAAELAKKATGRTCYILDEPTTGLHYADIEMLLQVLFRLRDSGNTLIMIEHHLDMIAAADHVIDLGPEGGQRGGAIMAQGPPEMIAAAPASRTGQCLVRHGKLSGSARAASGSLL